MSGDHKKSLLHRMKEGLNEDRLPASHWQHIAEHNRDATGANTIFNLLGRLGANPNAKSLAGGPVRLPYDGLFYIAVGIVLLLACLILIGTGAYISEWKSKNFTGQVSVIPSGLMPMGEDFEVQPNNTYYLPDSEPTFDLQVGERQERYDCKKGETLSFRVETQGTLIIDNFTNANIAVQTPLSFPGVVSVTCVKAGRLGFAQTAKVASPVISLPTTLPTEEVVEEEKTEVADQTQQVNSLASVPAPFSGQYFVVQVMSNGSYGKASPWAPLSAGSESYYGVLTTSSCDVPVSFPGQVNVYALVDVNQPVYGPEIKNGTGDVTIACDGFNTNIQYVVIAP